MRLRSQQVMSWFVPVFVLCLGLNSFAMPENGGSIASVNLETALTAGEKAPFEGVLVPYPQYYYYNEQVELNFENESRSQEQDCDSLYLKLGLTAVLFFVAGFSIGTN